MIYQDPLSALNPVLTVERQLTEVIERHTDRRGRAATTHAIELLERVGIPGAARRVKEYPHQFSGGMRQRVMIAMAISCSPRLLIADEPTTALDVTVQAQILELLGRLRADLGMALLLITHDLGVVAGVADRVAVMYAGRVVEEGPVALALDDPTHPYTLGLLASAPRLDQPRGLTVRPIPGYPPDMTAPPAGCAFRARCPAAHDRCLDDPRLEPVAADHRRACWASPTAARLATMQRAEVIG
jgi:oligopeptide transport system ATP-binding protein